MATTGANFVKLTSAQLVGSAVVAAGSVGAYNPSNASQIVNGGTGTSIDKVTVDLAKSAYAKNGAATVTLVGTTPVTIDLTDLTSATAASAGDTTFATWNQLVFNNTSATDVIITVAGSNGARFLLTGTTPGVTVPAGSSVTLQTAAGLAVDSTHKGLVITPTANGALTFAVGGA